MDHMHTHRRDDGTQAADAGADEARVDEQVAALEKWFGPRTDVHCLLVVDPSQRDPAQDSGSAIADLRRVEVAVDHDAVSPAHYPYLVELDLRRDSGQRALEESVALAFRDRRPQSMAEGLGQRIGGWIGSFASPNEVAAHFSRMALQRDDRNRLCLLRFYDSRSQSLLWPMLSAVQRQALMGPVLAWHTLDAVAMPVLRDNPQGRREDFELEAWQWQAIHRHGIVNRALALRAYEQDRQPTQHEVDAAVAAAERAGRYGLTDDEDVVAFVGHALSWHQEFDLHPRVQQLLASRPDGDLYAEQIEALSADEIAELRAGAWHERLRASDNAGRRA
jgi:hypothetical protein